MKTLERKFLMWTSQNKFLGIKLYIVFFLQLVSLYIINILKKNLVWSY